jgi:hypothetical protein
MNSVTISAIAFACMFGGALLGAFLRRSLPENHLSADSRDVVKLGAGLIATVAALVLGLMVSAAKTQFDSANEQIREGAASQINLDRILAQYGPETKTVREQLRAVLIARIDHLWPQDRSSEAGLHTEEISTEMEAVGLGLRNLTPRDESQRVLKSRAQDVFADSMKRRWSLLLKIHAPIPTVFVVLLVFWFSVLFIMFAMLSPANATVTAVQLICALSVAGGIFLILDMNRPFEGLVTLSNEPMQEAVQSMGR